jgi:hypothetical protein
MLGNISVSLLIYDKRGRRARNGGGIEVLPPDAKTAVSSWLYYAFKSVLLSHNSFFELINSEAVKCLSVKNVIFVILPVR